MYFNLFNCPLNKSVCLSIDASATVSPNSCLFITNSWQFMFFRDDEDVGVEPQRKESLVTFDSDPRMIVSSLSTVASLRTLSRLLRIENWKIEKLTIGCYVHKAPTSLNEVHHLTERLRRIFFPPSGISQLTYFSRSLFLSTSADAASICIWNFYRSIL
jgi:hypothetical protein